MNRSSKCANLVCCIMLIAFTGAGTALWGQTAGFAYVANCGGACTGGIGPGNVSAYTINGTTGALTPVAGSPFPAGTNPRSVTVHPTGQFVYVANLGSFNVSAYSIDGTTGLSDRAPHGPIRLRGECQFQERFGVQHQRDHRGADGGSRLALPGGSDSFLGDGGPHGPIRLRGE